MVHLHSSTASQRAQWVSELVAHEGSYGVVSQMSCRDDVSRETLYSWKAKRQRALEAGLVPRRPQALRAYPSDLEEAVLTVVEHAHTTCHGVQPGRTDVVRREAR